MAAPKVRADYEQLQEVASRFGSQAQAARQTLQRLQQHLEVLQGGDWVGQGAQAFYAEMNSQVVPTMNRLIGALEQAADTTRQIRQVVQEAEGEAAAVFRTNGQSVTAGAISAGPLGGGAAAAFVAARPGPRRGHAGPAAKALPGTLLAQLAAANPKLAAQVQKDKSLAMKLRLLDERMISVSVGKVPYGGEYFYDGATLTVDPKHAVEALTDFANDTLYSEIKLLPGLGQKLAEEVKKDPVLMEQLRELDLAGWSIKLGAQPGVSVVADPIITLDPARPLESLRQEVRSWQRLQSYADEKPKPGDDHDSYMQRNLGDRMYADASEMLHVYAAHFRVEGQMPSTLLNGKHSTHMAEYDRVVSDYLANNSPDDPQPMVEATAKLKTLLDSEPPGISNAQRYEAELNQKWNQMSAAAHK